EGHGRTAGLSSPRRRAAVLECLTARRRAHPSIEAVLSQMQRPQHATRMPAQPVVGPAPDASDIVRLTGLSQTAGLVLNADELTLQRCKFLGTPRAEVDAVDQLRGLTQPFDGDTRRSALAMFERDRIEQSDQRWRVLRSSTRIAQR